MDWFPKHPTDYRNGTWHLTLSEHGAYNLLIDHYMLYESPLPNNDIALAGILGVPLDEWNLVRENVLKLFKISGSKLRHNRCDDELESAFSKRRDGKTRQKKHRKLLKDHDSATCDKHVSNATEDIQDIQDKQVSNICGSREAFDLYNSFAEIAGWKKAAKLSDARKRKLKARLKDVGGIDGWKIALEKASKISGLSGGDGKWKANLDFFLQESSFIKLMEGSYDSWGADGDKLTGFQAAAARRAQ